MPLTDGWAASDQELQQAISARRSLKHLDLAMERFVDSQGWRSAESRMRNMVLPLAPYIGRAELARLRTALETNSQIREASSMPPLLEQFYETTKDRPGMQAEWEVIVSILESKAPNGDSEHYFAYPRLRAMVRGGNT